MTASAFGSEQHDLVLSLGTNCAITYNLRHFFGLKETGPLDWMITPLSALPLLIQNGFELADSDFAASLEHTQLGDTDGVLHRPTGVMIQHEFPRDWRRRISPRWRDAVGAVAEKHTFLARRLHARLSQARAPAVFIYGTGWHEALSAELCEATHREDIYARIIEAFRDAYPLAEPTFYLMQGHAPSVDYVKGRSDVRVARVGEYGQWHEGKEGHYAGHKQSWRDAFASLDAVPGISEAVA